MGLEGPVGPVWNPESTAQFPYLLGSVGQGQQKAVSADDLGPRQLVRNLLEDLGAVIEEVLAPWRMNWMENP